MASKTKVGIIVQARLGSSRLPGKIMNLINNRTMVEILLERLSKVKLADQVIVAIPDDQNNITLEDYLNSINLDFSIYKGSESDVLSRYYHAAKKYNLGTIVRITSDCPAMDSNLVDLVIKKFAEKNCDYLSNIRNEAYPDGMDIEIFSIKTLKSTFKKALEPLDREHVTRYMFMSGKFNCKNFTNNMVEFNHKISVDTKEDMELIKIIFNNFYPDIYFSFEDIIDFMKKNDQIIIS